MNLIGDKLIKAYLRLVEPIGGFLVSTGIHPNTVTWIGLFFTVIASYMLTRGIFFWGGIMIAVAGTCDILDGMVARRNGMKSKFGAFFDSTIDRYSDILIFLGLAIYFNTLWIHILIVITITGTLLTSYTRARAGALRIDCKVGMMQRPERIAYIAAACVFDGIIGGIFKMEHFLIQLVVIFIAIVSNYTVIQRVVHVKRELEKIELEDIPK